jgi:hypothetical protein
MTNVSIDASLCLTKKVCLHCLAAEQCRYSNIENNLAGVAYIVEPKTCVSCLEKHQFCSAKPGCASAKSLVAQRKTVDDLSPAIVMI